LGNLTIRADVEERKKAFGIPPEIFVKKKQGADSHEEDENALADFKRRHSPEQAPLPQVMAI
jgi:hypothetical protein